jgi:hypothetical protein
MIVWFASMAHAAAPEELTPGELWGFWSGWTGNAYTVPKGNFVFHPFIRSGVGLTDFWDLKFSIQGELFGPQLATEVGYSNDLLAASFEARGKVGWGFNALDYALTPHFSIHAGEKAMADVSLSIVGQSGTKRIQTANGAINLSQPGLKAVRPELAFDIFASDHSWFILTARSDLLGWKENGAHGTFGGYVAYGKDVFGMSLGMNIAILGLQGFGEDWDAFEQSLGADLWNPPPAVPLPLPHAQIWFRL